MNSVRIVSLCTFAFVAACSSSTGTTPSGDRGLTGSGDPSAATAPDVNPYGVPYPSTNIGTNPRKGATPGNRIQNFKFLGYPNGNKADGLQPVSLAQYFDPEGRKFKMVHIQASGLWCNPCQMEAKTVTPLAPKLDERKVVWLMSVVEGATPGHASTQTDLNSWLKQFNAPFTQVLDPGNENLGPFYDAAAIPWNANINAQTMEILSSGVGALASETQILADLDKWITQIDSGALK